jgi:hypothetical protein
MYEADEATACGFHSWESHDWRWRIWKGWCMACFGAVINSGSLINMRIESMLCLPRKKPTEASLEWVSVGQRGQCMGFDYLSHRLSGCQSDREDSVWDLTI